MVLVSFYTTHIHTTATMGHQVILLTVFFLSMDLLTDLRADLLRQAVPFPADHIIPSNLPTRHIILMASLISLRPRPRPHLPTIHMDLLPLVTIPVAQALMALTDPTSTPNIVTLHLSP